MLVKMVDRARYEVKVLYLKKSRDAFFKINLLSICCKLQKVKWGLHPLSFTLLVLITKSSE